MFAETPLFGTIAKQLRDHKIGDVPTSLNKTFRLLRDVPRKTQRKGKLHPEKNTCPRHSLLRGKFKSTPDKDGLISFQGVLNEETCYLWGHWERETPQTGTGGFRRNLRPPHSVQRLETTEKFSRY